MSKLINIKKSKFRKILSELLTVEEEAANCELDIYFLSPSADALVFTRLSRV